MVAAILATALLAPTTVRIESPALDVRGLLVELSRQTGVRHEVGANLETSVVAARLSEVDAEEVRRRLAEVLIARWLRDGEGWRLVPDAAQRQRMRDADAEEEARFFRSFVAEQAEASGLDRPYDASAARAWAAKLRGRKLYDNIGGAVQTVQGNRKLFGEATAASPAGRAMARALATVDPQVSLALARGERVVFTYPPTRSQRPLREGESILATLRREQGLWLEASKGLGPFAPENYFVWDTPSQQPLPPEARHLWLILTGSGWSLQATLFVAHDSGELAMQRMASPDFDRRIARAPAGSAPKPDTAVLEVPPLVAEFVGLARRGRAVAELRPSPALQAALLAPETTEPQALGMGGALLAYAQQQNRPLLARLPEGWLYNPPLYDDLGRVMRGQVRSYVQERDGWLMRRPTVEDWEAPTFDRGDLGRLLRAHAVGGATPELIAAAARRVPIGQGDMPGALSVSLNLVGEAFNFADLGTLRLFASLTPEQRRTLDASEPLPVEAWSGAQRAIIRAILGRPLGMGGNFMPPRGPTRMPWPVVFEPTFYLADGFPPGTALRVVRRTQRYALQFRQNGGDQTVGLDVLPLLQKAQREGSMTQPLPQRFQLVLMDETSYAIDFGGRGRFDGNLTWMRSIKRDATLETLPPPARRALEEAQKRIGGG